MKTEKELIASRSRLLSRRILMKSVFISTFLAAFFLMPLHHAVASDLRCGSKLISVGDSKYDVLRKCGEPAHVETWQEFRTGRDLFISVPVSPEVEIFRRSPTVQEFVTVEEWEYDLGQSRFIRYLRFENGRLIRIRTGDYGD
jgi:hypothetical protein